MRSVSRILPCAGWLILGLAGVALSVADAWTPPEGFSIPKSTLSPDGTYGVLVPDWEHYQENDAPQNQLVNVKTGEVLTTIDAETWVEDESGRTLNHRSLAACWSKDGMVLGWVVTGKWSPSACVLIKVGGGKVIWQLDILKSVQPKMLAATKTAAPGNYAAAKEHNKDFGSAYPEGFTIDIDTPQADFSLPWRGHAALDSNPKSIADGWPPAANVSASMNFIVRPNGDIHFSDFSIDPEQTGVSRCE